MLGIKLKSYNDLMTWVNFRCVWNWLLGVFMYEEI